VRGAKQEIRPGVWRLRVVDRYDREGRPHQLSRTVSGTKRQAESALAAFVSEVDRGTAPTSGGLMLGAYLTDQWLPHIKANREPTTYETHKGKVEKIKASTLGHVRLDKLTPRHFDAAYNEWGETLMPGTVKTMAVTISAALEQAVKWGLLSTNKAKFATVPRVPQRKSTMPTLKEIGTLIDVAEKKDPILAVTIALAARTGMRRGELCGIRWCDIDVHRMTINVETAAKRITGKTYTGDTKTHRARIFIIDPALSEILKTHRDRMTRIGKGADNDFLFTWRTGHDQPVNPDAMSMRFDRVAKAAGVKCRLHDLRHAVASHLLSNGVDVVTASRRVGMTPKTMLATYAHGLEEADRTAAGIMDGLLTATTGTPHQP
jgi:integrase